MAKTKSQASAINPPSDSTRDETDYEHSQRFLNDVDRTTFQGVHPPSMNHMGPRGIVHKMSIASHVPHIYKEDKK